MAHPDKENSDEFKKMVTCTRTYETLFHRVFLKILDTQETTLIDQ
jgi:hypothetical protein